MANRQGYSCLSGHGVQAARLTQSRRRQQYPNATKQKRGRHNAREDEEGHAQERQQDADSQTENFATSATEENHSI